MNGPADWTASENPLFPFYKYWKLYFEWSYCNSRLYRRAGWRCISYEGEFIFISLLARKLESRYCYISGCFALIFDYYCCRNILLVKEARKHRRTAGIKTLETLVSLWIWKVYDFLILIALNFSFDLDPVSLDKIGFFSIIFIRKI